MNTFDVRKILIFTFILQTTIVFAQKNKDENYELAKQLGQKYSESSAVILKLEKTFEFSLDKNLVSVIEKSAEEIISTKRDVELRRRVYYDINSKITKGEVKSVKNKRLAVTPICGNYEVDNIFYSDEMQCVYPINLNTIGEVVNFDYELKTDDIRYYTKEFFNQPEPVKKIVYTYKVPSWLDVELKEINFNGYKIDKKVIKDPKGTTIYTYSISDLDEYKDEPNSFSASYTYPHLLVIAKKFTDKEGKKNSILGNTNDLYSWCNQLVTQLKNENSELKPTVDKLVVGAKSDLDKVKAIFYWVQDNIRYIAFENGIAGYKPAEAAEVFKKKYGDCKGMANLTKSMLKLAGFDARLVWIGTSSIPYDYKTTSLAIFNHMICCVYLNNQRYFLDATEKYIGINDYAERIQGRKVIIEDGNRYTIDSIPTFTKDRNLSFKKFDLTIKENSFTGKCTQNYRGESHQGLLYYLNNKEQETQKKLTDYLITKGDKNIIANSVVTSDQSDKENPYNIEADVIINNKISNFDNDYYLDLDFYKDFNNKVFKDNRVSDINFNEKIYQKVIVNLTIPNGFKLKQLPSSLDIAEKNFSFTIRYSIKDNLLTYERVIATEKSSIPKSEIVKWNNAIKSLSAKYKDVVVLTKL